MNINWNWVWGLGVAAVVYLLGWNSVLMQDVAIVMGIISIVMMFPNPRIQEIGTFFATFWAIAFVILPMTVDRTLLDWPLTREALNARGIYTDRQLSESITPNGLAGAEIIAKGAEEISKKREAALYARMGRVKTSAELDAVIKEAKSQTEWRNKIGEDINEIGDMSKPMNIPSKPIWWRLMGLGVSLLLTMLVLNILRQDQFSMARGIRWAGAMALVAGFILFFLPEAGKANPLSLIPSGSEKWYYVVPLHDKDGRRSMNRTEFISAFDVQVNTRNVGFKFYDPRTKDLVIVSTKSSDGENYAGVVENRVYGKSPISFEKISDKLFRGKDDGADVSLQMGR